MEGSSLFLKNPHSVWAALESRPKEVLKVVVPGDDLSPAWEQVVEYATQLGVRVEKNTSGRSRGGKASKSPGSSGGRVSAAEAWVKPRRSISIEELWKGGESEDRGLWLALDGLQDPQNVGSIFRTASYFGVRGILLTDDRSSPLTSTVYDVASGGVETVPFCLHNSFQQAFESAKEAGLWIVGTSEHAKDSIRAQKSDRRWILVLGNEEKGMRRLTHDLCDVVCKIPKGPAAEGVTSLNVAAAASILIWSLGPK